MRGEEEVARRKKMLTIGVCSSVHERGGELNGWTMNDMWGPLVSVSKKPHLFHQMAFSFLKVQNRK
jgi:hypothetical protein